MNATTEKGYRVAKKKRRRYRIPILRDSHVAQLAAQAISALRSKREHYAQRTWMYHEHYAQRTRLVVEKVQKLFLAMSEMAAQRHIQLVVVLIPAREQVYPDEYPFDDYDFLEERDLDKPQRIFTDFFEAAGIAYLDLLPLMKLQPTRPTLYYPVDRHWTFHGNDVGSTAMAEYLLARKLVPPSLPR